MRSVRESWPYFLKSREEYTSEVEGLIRIRAMLLDIANAAPLVAVVAAAPMA
jgi:hypothetical protein